ncbi:hypothetical protein KL906_004459 [Ogataea polymorpha]|nr:hypothetical protein KL937_004194 [Ogataea polymorpha]KAG7887278.1 hypothetical protein KL936_004438 [Ogataea polymorpha]KAG7906367.1 hypothetical protein KL906_004459 [Ogataea polymorpha]KAG7930837.1 hypothetical protein KL934_004462 [Ogataea polymorpha]
MITLLFLGLLLLAEDARSALLNVRSCYPSKNMDDALLSPFFTNVSYNDDDGRLDMNLVMDSMGYIVDVNETTNTYTTLHVRLKYVGDVILDEYLRLCNYSRVLRADGDVPVSTTTSQESSTSTHHRSLVDHSTDIPQISDMIQKRDVPQLLDRSGSFDDSCPIYDGDEVAVDLSLYIGHHSPFGTYSLDVTVINSDANHTVIGCSLATFSTVQKRSLQNFMVVFTALLLSLILLSNILGYQLSPYIDTQNPFLYKAASICNAPLLNQLSPGYADYLVYIQFIHFMAGLNLEYPGFFQPLMASQRWAGVMDLLHNHAAMGVDGVYESLWMGGLKRLLGSGFGKDGLPVIWSSFLITAVIYIAIACVIDLGICSLVLLLKPKDTRPNFARYIRLSFLTVIGNILSAFIGYIATPSLIYSFFVLSVPHTHLYGQPEIESNPHWVTATASLLLALYFLLQIYYVVRFILIKRGRDKLYKSINVILIWQWAYVHLKTSALWFVAVTFLEHFVFSFAVGALQFSGVVQLIVIICSELVLLCVMLFWEPYYPSTGTNRTKISLAVVKLIIAFLHIAFIDGLNGSEKARTRVVWSILVIELVTLVLVFLVPTLYNFYTTFKMYIKYRNGKKGTEIPDYIEHGNPIEVPVLPDNHSLASFDESFNNWTFETPALLRTSSGTPSVNSKTLELTDHRVVPAVTTGPSMKHTHKSDLAFREADLYYNSFKDLEPDPEVMKLWQERERKLHRAVSVEFEKKEGKGVEKKGGSKGFEVMRPRPRMRMLAQRTNTSSRSSIVSETAQRHAASDPTED